RHTRWPRDWSSDVCSSDLGHDHQEGAEMLEGRVTVSTAGTLSTRARGGRPVSFNFVTIDPAAVQVTFFRWDSAKQRFQPSDTARSEEHTSELQSRGHLVCR